MAEITNAVGGYTSTGGIAVCEFCNIRIEPDHPRTYRHVQGWEHPRDAGGTNAIALRHPDDRFACWVCIDKLRKGIPVGQEHLL